MPGLSSWFKADCKVSAAASQSRMLLGVVRGVSHKILSTRESRSNFPCEEGNATVSGQVKLSKLQVKLSKLQVKLSKLQA